MSNEVKVKTKVNDMCHCGSNKKYKKCCLLADQAKQVEENTYEQSEELTTAMNILKLNFPDIEFKNVTTKLNTQTYRPMQINHFNDNVCQVAERIKTNDRVFKERDNSEEGDYDLLLMYHGAYRILYNGANVSVYTLSLKSFFTDRSKPEPINVELEKQYKEFTKAFF